MFCVDGMIIYEYVKGEGIGGGWEQEGECFWGGGGT